MLRERERASTKQRYVMICNFTSIVLICDFKIMIVFWFTGLCVCSFLSVMSRSAPQCAFASLCKLPTVPPPEVGISPLIKLLYGLGGTERRHMSCQALFMHASLCCALPNFAI